MTTTIHTPLRLLVARTLLALAAGFGSAQAAPTLPQVVSGQASFAQQGNVFSITNAPNTIINWQSFSVNPGEVTRFIQQSSDSAVLNRIVGQDPSKILGALQSNGQVFLINPNGILFGKDARVDVNGLTASTLNLSDADFLAGKRKFTAGVGPNPGSGAGKLVNQGSIATPNGGKVFLIASSIENSGVITTPDGAVVLAAGHSVQLADSGNPDLHVVVSAPADEAINLGQIVAQGGRIGIYGALVRQRGVVNADSAQVGKNGKIVFKASGDTTVEAGSTTSANGAGRGGEVQLLGERVGITGDARIDASGMQGGGTVLVGGGYQGKDARLPNARQTVFGKHAAIRADALAAGDGGTVVLWANDSTRAYGSLSALGAAAGKDGLVETSAYQLDVNGIKVKAGTWLLDPYDLDIVASPAGSLALANVDEFLEGATSGVSQLGTATLAAASTSANVVLQASHDINFRDPVTRAPGTTGSLMVEAGNNINVYADLNTNGGKLFLNARQGPTVNSAGSIKIENDVVTGGGKLFASGYNVALTASAWVNTGGGDIDLRASNEFSTQAGAVLRSDGFIDIMADKVSLLSNIGPSGPTLPIVSFRPASAARTIDIVDADTAGASLHLSPAELSLIRADTISIGHVSTTGPVRVASPLTLTPALTRNLVLETQGDIDITAQLSLGTGSTLLLARNGTSGQRINVGATGSLSAGGIILQSDDINLSGSVSAPSIELMPNTDATPIDLGGTLDAAVGRLVLSAAELNRLSSSRVSIGGNDGQMGNMYLTAGLNLASSNIGTAALNLQAGDGVLMFNGTLQTLGALTLQGSRIEGETGARVSAPSIALSATDGIGTITPFMTGTAHLTADNHNPGGSAPINISNVGVMNLGSVTQSGTDNSGNISVANAGGMTVLANDAGKPVAVATNGGIMLRTQSPLTIYGSVATSGGPIALEAGNGGVMTIGGGAYVAASTGSISITGGSVVNNGTVATSGGNIAVAGTLSGSGAFAAPNGTVSANGVILPGTGTGTGPGTGPGTGTCTSNPSGPGCGPLPPTLNECVSAPTTAGCSAVLPPLATCVANPAAPGCAVVLPTVDACVANPAAPGCAVVLPTVDACVANPAAPGCAVVLPSLPSCTATPSAPGCSVVLPSLAACTAAPSTPGCGAVLPSLPTCTSAPATAGCGVVLPTLASCVAAPSTAGCSVVLPTLASCTANPSAPGCTVVLPTLAQCSAAPSSAGCVAVLPSLAQCTISPGQAGCAVVLPTITVCSVTPSTAGCSAVLPSLASCVATPTVPGCAVVLPSVSACVAAPGTAGCSVVLPTLSSCIASPGLAGCSVVLPTLAQCTASPSLQGCAVVLPPVSACVANPTAPGCVVVVPPSTPAPASEVGQAINNTVTVVNTVVSKVSQPTTAGTSTGAAALAGPPAAPDTGASQEKKDDKNSGTEAPTTVRDIEGANGGKIVKKTYCN